MHREVNKMHSGTPLKTTKLQRRKEVACVGSFLRGVPERFTSSLLCVFCEGVKLLLLCICIYVCMYVCICVCVFQSMKVLLGFFSCVKLSELSYQLHNYTHCY